MNHLPQEPVSKNELQLRKLANRDKMMRTFEVFILSLVVILTFFSLNRINQLATSNQKNIIEHAKQVETVTTANRARLDINLCIVSVPPQTRTPEYVHKCYDDAEKLYEVKVVRYGYGNN